MISMISLQRSVAVFTVISICLQPSAISGQNASAPKQATASPSAQHAASSQDNGWPREVTGNGSTLLYYQPQIDDWKDFKILTGRAAVGLTPKGGKTVLGVASFEAETTVDHDNRTVYFNDLKYTSVRFQRQDASDQANLEQVFRSSALTAIQPVALDRVLSDVDRSKTPAPAVQVRNDPPQIFYSSSPAILLMVQGQPVLNPIEKTDLQSVVNTNWDLFFDKSKKRYYLLVDNLWLTATDLRDPWTRTNELPKDMAKLPPGQNWDAVKAKVPPPATSTPAPRVFYSDTPAELILARGAPVYMRIAGTQLLYVTNTDNDLFMDDAEQQYYVLLSGRWFRAKTLNGSWSYAGDSLPKDFAEIPETSPKGRVLASVPGTAQASDAVLLAQIPTTVTVNRAEVEAKVQVTYDGQPQFKSIENTSLEYATNTQDKVIRDGDLYYLCFQGIWFMSTTPNGPWKTADSIPKEIYSIPPSSPVYNVTYVTQTNPTATTVDCSTTAGYFGMFVVGMTAGVAIAYGTGYYYPPYVYWGPGYPIYRPWPMTYGAGVVYNPWTGGWAAGRAVYGPYGAAGSSAWYNPATGRYGRAASVQGWYGGRTVASAYNPWTGGYAATSQGHNAYSQWGTSVATRNGQAIQTGHVTTANGTIAGYRTSTGQRGGAISGQNGTVVKGPNSVYAGNDGNVYRKDSSGSWSKYDNGNWNSVDTSAAKQQVQQNLQNNHPQAQQNLDNARQQKGSQAPSLYGEGRNNTPQVSPGTMDGLNRSAESRQRGQMQSQRYQNFRRGGGRFRR
jgi:hypothetical protein